MRPPSLDPLEAEAPTVELVNPTPTVGRHAVQAAAQRTHLAHDDVEALVVATSEVVTNAINHGRPPVTLRLWAAPERMVAAVTDRGEGPQDPYVGLVPQPGAASGTGGYGLWIAHQLTAVTYSRDTEGFTVHLLAGRALT